MKSQRLLRVALLACLLFPSSTVAQAVDAKVLRIATLAPKSSPIGQGMQQWSRAVAEGSAGSVAIEGDFNGRAGDEAEIVAKVRAGELDGAILTAAGLDLVHRPLLAFELPGLFGTWAELDASRDSLRSELEAGASAAGFTLGGWVDVGVRRLMTRSVAVRLPEDLRQARLFIRSENALEKLEFELIGSVAITRGSAAAVYVGLRDGTVNALRTTPLGAEMFDWAQALDLVAAEHDSFEIGALVLSSKRLAGLSPEQRALVIDAARVATAAANAKIREWDAKSLAKLLSSKTVVEFSPEERAAWKQLHRRVRAEAARTLFSPGLVQKLEASATPR